MLALLGLGNTEIVVLLILAVTIGTWVFALVDCVKVPDHIAFRAGSKVIWVLVIALTGIIGAVLYFLIGRPARTWK